MAGNNSQWLDECQAPTYVNFLSLPEDNDENDNFFDTDDDVAANSTQFFTPRKTPARPRVEDEQNASSLEDGPRKVLKARRSLSKPQNDVENTRTAFEAMLSLKSPYKAHGMITRQDVDKETRTIELRSRHVACKPSLKRKAVMDEYSAKIPKTMTLAESVLRFQLETPPRFRTVSVNFKPSFKKEEKRPLTVPQSPVLNTMSLKHDNKPSCSEDKENAIFPQIKAHPLNRKIFESPKLPRPEPKPATVVRQFNLTQIQEKPKPDTIVNTYEFKAQPVPNVSSEGDRLGQKIRKKWIIPEHFEFKINDLSKSTAPQPFSFEERDRKRRLERDKKLKQMRDGQNKITPFRATPLPSCYQHSDDTSSVLSTSSRHSCLSNIQSPVFRARPPSVLYQEPFVPRIEKPAPVKPIDITLSTEVRAQRRRELDIQRKLKEEEQEAARKENDRLRQEMERREIQELRQNLVHKPVPLPDLPK